MCTWHCYLSMKIIKYITGNEMRFSIQQKKETEENKNKSECDI